MTYIITLHLWDILWPLESQIAQKKILKHIIRSYVNCSGTMNAQSGGKASVFLLIFMVVSSLKVFSEEKKYENKIVQFPHLPSCHLNGCICLVWIQQQAHLDTKVDDTCCLFTRLRLVVGTLKSCKLVALANSWIFWLRPGSVSEAQHVKSVLRKPILCQRS